MCKSTEKKQSYNSLVVSELAKRYECTKVFVRLSIKGERTSERADNIRKDYLKLTKKVDKVLTE